MSLPNDILDEVLSTRPSVTSEEVAEIFSISEPEARARLAERMARFDCRVAIVDGKFQFRFGLPRPERAKPSRLGALALEVLRVWLLAHVIVAVVLDIFAPRRRGSTKALDPRALDSLFLFVLGPKPTPPPRPPKTLGQDFSVADVVAACGVSSETASDVFAHLVGDCGGELGAKGTEVVCHIPDRGPTQVRTAVAVGWTIAFLVWLGLLLVLFLLLLDANGGIAALIAAEIVGTATCLMVPAFRRVSQNRGRSLS
jgi:hypothetical protein